MDSDAWFDERFGGSRTLVIARGLGAAATLARAEQVWAAGVPLFEVPIRTPADIEALRAVAAAAAARGLAVGAGTVVLPEQVAAARDAGAAFVVSPGLDDEVVRACLDTGLAVLPGVATPSEVQRALRLGLRWVKAFPAAQLGTGWFRAMRAPFPDVRFVATGGITPDNADEYLAAGARAVAFGSGLTEPGQLDRFA